MSFLRSRFLWPVIILLIGAVLALMVNADFQSPLREMLALGYLMFCPGMAFIPLLGMRKIPDIIILGIALSLTLDTVVAGTALYLQALQVKTWHPSLTFNVLVGISCVGAVLQLWPSRRIQRILSPHPETAPQKHTVDEEVAKISVSTQPVVTPKARGRRRSYEPGRTSTARKSNRTR